MLCGNIVALVYIFLNYEWIATTAPPHVQKMIQDSPVVMIYEIPPRQMCQRGIMVVFLNF